MFNQIVPSEMKRNRVVISRKRRVFIICCAFAGILLIGLGLFFPTETILEVGAFAKVAAFLRSEQNREVTVITMVAAGVVLLLVAVFSIPGDDPHPPDIMRLTLAKI